MCCLIVICKIKSDVAVATVNNNAIVVIGGYSRGDNMANRKASSLKVIELGQVEIQ